MNAGYVAAWLILTSAILLATGWKKQLLDDVRVSSAVSFMILLTAATITAGRLDSGADDSPLSWTMMPLILTGGCALWMLGTIRPGPRRIYTVSCALLAGAVWIWSRKLYDVDPVFVLWNAALDGPLGAGVLTAILTVRFREQFTAAAGAALLTVWAVWPSLDEPWVWLDGFAAALASARVTSAAAGAVRSAFGRLRMSSGEGAE